MKEKAKWKNRLFFNARKKCEEIDNKIQKIEQMQDKVLNNYYFHMNFYNVIIENMQLNNPTLIRG